LSALACVPPGNREKREIFDERSCQNQATAEFVQGTVLLSAVFANGSSLIYLSEYRTQSTIRRLHERLSHLQSQCATSDVLSGSIVAANALSRAFAAVTSAQKSVNTADMTPGKITPADLKRIILSAETVLEGAELEVKRELEKELAWQAVKGEAADFVTTAKTRVEAAISALRLMNLVVESGQPTSPPAVASGLLAAIAMTISEAVEAVAVVEDLYQRQRGLSIDPGAAVSTIVDVPALKQFMNAAEDRVSVLEATVTLETRKRRSESELKAKQEASR
jgi:hypothetical protein